MKAGLSLWISDLCAPCLLQMQKNHPFDDDLRGVSGLMPLDCGRESKAERRRMTLDQTHEISTAADVLALSPADVAQFVRDCVRNRSLSVMVSDLNHTVLHGTSEEREEARRALKHLGFV